MKIALGEKVNYYEICPFCGSERVEGKDSCEKCGKSLIKTVEKKDSASEEEEVSLYKVREEKSASETFKSLKGKSKARFFVDYYLGKIIFVGLILALLGSILYSTLKPKPQPVLYIAMVVSPFLADGEEQFKDALSDMFVKDDGKEEILFDKNYSSLVADYNSMMAYTMHLSAGEIDMVILTKEELKYQVNNQALAPVKDVLSKEVFEKLDDSVKYSVLPTYIQDNGDFEYGTEDIYGLNIEKFLEKANGFETSNKYCVAFTTVAPHKDKFDQVVKYMFDIK